jgi:biopolymer transport protein ExbD
VFVETRRGPIFAYPIVCILFVSMLVLCAIGLLTRGEFAESIDLPESTVAVLAPRSAGVPRVVVNVESNGRLLVAGRRVQSHELEALFLSEQSKSPTNKVELMIRADRMATYAMVTPVLSAALCAGVVQINFAVRNEAGREDVRWVLPAR